MKQYYCQLADHEDSQIGLVDLRYESDYEQRFLCVGECLLSNHLQEHKKSILILKDVLKNENVFQLINDNPTLKDIYNFSYLNSKEDPPLLKEITLLFQELRTSIIFSLDRLENDFKGKLQQNHQQNRPYVLDLFKKLNKYYNLSDLKEIIKNYKSDQITVQQANSMINDYSSVINDFVKQNEVTKQYTDLREKHQFMQFDKQLFLKHQAGILEILNDINLTISDQVVDFINPEFWKTLNTRSSPIFRMKPNQMVVKFSPNLHNAQFDDIKTSENIYTMNVKKSAQWRCMYSESFDRKDRVFFKIKISGGAQFMLNISTWDERNNYFSTNKTGNLINSLNNSNGYTPPRNFKQIGSKTLSEIADEVLPNEYLELYVYVSVEENSFVILDDSKQLYYSSNYKFEEDNTWFFGITSCSKKQITVFEILCGRTLR